MDIMTLAAANAYTDKKVAEGGGAGGATVINFDELGLTNLIVGAYMQGGCTNTDIDIDHNALWGNIPVDGNYRIKFGIDGVSTCLYTPTFTTVVDTLGTVEALRLNIELVADGTEFNFSVTLESTGSIGSDGFDYYRTTMTVTPKA